MKTLGILRTLFGFDNLGVTSEAISGKKEKSVDILRLFLSLYFCIFASKKLGFLGLIATYFGFPMMLFAVLVGGYYLVATLFHVSAGKKLLGYEIVRRILGFVVAIYYCYINWTYLGFKSIAYVVIAIIFAILQLGKKSLSDFSNDAMTYVNGFVVLFLSI